eukprot:5055078-Ditylum_brightwellii.AAC.1
MLSTVESFDGDEEVLLHPIMSHMTYKPAPTPKHKAIKFVFSSVSFHIRKKSTQNNKCLTKDALLRDDDLCSKMLGNVEDRTCTTTTTAAIDPASIRSL